MSSVKFAPVLLAILLLGTACVPPTHVISQRASALPRTDSQILSSPLAFTSTLEVTEFAAENEQLIALGYFTVTDFEGTTETVPVSLPVIDMTSGASCSYLTVILGPLNLQVLGMSVNAQTVQFVTTANPDKGFDETLLCGIVDTFKNADMELVAIMLNEVLSLFA